MTEKKLNSENLHKNIAYCENAICKQCELNVSSRVKANMMIIYENIRLKMAEKKLETKLRESFLLTSHLKETMEATVSKNNELQNTIKVLEQNILAQQESNSEIPNTESYLKQEWSESSLINKKLSLNLVDLHFISPFSSNGSNTELNQSECFNNVRQLDSEDPIKNCIDTFKLFDIINQLYTKLQVTNEVVYNQNLELVSFNKKYSSVLHLLNQIRKNIKDMQNLLLKNLHKKEDYREELKELLISFAEIEDELITNRNENQLKDEKIEALSNNMLFNFKIIKEIQQENDALKLKLQTVTSSKFQKNDSAIEKSYDSKKDNYSTKIMDQSNQLYDSVTTCNFPCLKNLSNILRSSDSDCYPLTSTLTSTAYMKKNSKTVNNFVENTSQIISDHSQNNFQEYCDWTYFAEQIESISKTIQNIEVNKKIFKFKKKNNVDMLRIRLRLNVIIELMTKKKINDSLETQITTFPKMFDVTQLIEIAKQIYENYK
ncbi:interaptin-like [Hydra vulgaris]|uniref:Interaptin-like n=1 Tax=Hydra vulgaris TaxID=6087 RepID=A0ABM4DGK2_HYDVU